MVLNRRIEQALMVIIWAGPLFVSVAAWAGITVGGDTGEVTPANPSLWTSTTTGNIGINAGKTGTITVDGSSTLLSSYGYLGYYPGATGNVAVNGAGSTWTNTNYLYMGFSGRGNLTIASGGKVSDSVGHLGFNMDSAGSALVTDPGSLWSNSGALYAGWGSTGNLTIANGGKVSNTTGYVGYNSSAAGNVTVTGNGSTWTNTSSLYVGNSGTGSLSISNGGNVTNTYGYLGNATASSGTVTVTDNGSWWTNSGPLYVGNSGTGSLAILNGGKVSVMTGYLGYNSGSSGRATVSGNGSTWTSSSSLFVGYSGTGNLTIASGGQVISNISTDVAYGAGHTGTANVTGTGSLWTNTGTLSVGSYGNGSLDISLGGQVSANEGVIGNFSGATGNVTVIDNGSTWTNNGPLAVGSRGAGGLTIANGGKVSNTGSYLGDRSGSTGNATVTGTGSTWTSNGTQYVGNNGTGIMNISSGGQVSAANGYVGYLSGSAGNVTVTDPGSTWTLSNTLYLGYYSIGNLTIANGGQVSDTNANLNSASGSKGTATVTGTGSTWTNNGTLTVDGTGNLTILNGGKVLAGEGILGNNFGSGSAIVTGNSSTWTMSGNLVVGYWAAGNLTIANGGKVSNNIGGLGDLNGNGNNGNGTVTVTDAGSTWTNNGALSVGGQGSGTLIIVNGGQVSSVGGSIVGFKYNGARGLVTVSGNGSKWISSSNLTVGGNLSISAGGQVSNTNGFIEDGYYANGNVAVVGSGSTWTNSGNLQVGSSGNSTLLIAGGGKVSDASGYIGYYVGSSGNVTVTDAGSTWTNSNILTVGNNGTGSLCVKNGGVVTAKIFWAAPGDLTGNGTINVKGWVADDNLVFDAAHGAQCTVLFGTGGALTVSPNGSAVLGAGYKAAGTLSVAGGITVAGTTGYLGYNAGASGAATVTGNGSAWTSSSPLYVGYSGNGTLTIAAGGKVSNSGGYLGYNSGSAGQATVTGAGSTWTNNGDLWVGSSGTGALCVTNGGVVTARNLWATPGDLTGNGTINIKGWVADADLVFDAVHGGQNTIPFGSGGAINLSPDGGAVLGAGYKGAGTLTITDGLTMTATTGYLGYYSGATGGTALVSGNNSTWTLSGNFYNGYNGDGVLTIFGGAKVNNVAAYLGYNAGSSGQVTVTGTGSNWTNSGNLQVGFKGTGVVTITNGGQVSNVNGFLGNSTSASGQVFVTGAGSTWTNSGNLYMGIGYLGSSSLTIAAGGKVSDTVGFLGYSSAPSQATVTDAGSTWINSGALYVGYSYGGNLLITNGGRVSSAGGYIGNNGVPVGVATVTGNGSTWTNNGTLYAGYYGKGNLTVADHGQIMTTALSINSTSNVSLRVSGNSMLVLGSNTTVGNLTNNGTLNLYADTALALGVYTPITVCDGQTMTWTGNGSYKTWGGAWDNAAKTFTVPANTLLAAGGTDILSTNERLLFTGTGQQVGASFGTITGSPTFSANLMSDSLKNDLQTIIPVGQSVLSAWTYTSNLTTNPVLLSYYVGTGLSSLEIWNYKNSVWTQVAPDTLAYNSNGIASFLASGLNLNGFAVTGATGSGPGVLSNGEIAPANPATWSLNNYGKIGITAGNTGAVTVSGNSQLLSEECRLGVNAGSAGSVLVTDNGSTWTANTSIFVGYSGSGNLTVANGGRVVNSYGYLGYNAGSTGQATVTGARATWMSGVTLSVGYSGTGYLTIANGGTVNNSVVYLGLNAGSRGVVTVTGSGSQLICSDGLYVGNAGTGKLRVEDGGVVTTKTLFAARADLQNDSGTGLIQTKGWMADADLVVDAGHGLHQLLSFGTGGTVDLNLDGAGGLGAGYQGQGSVRISDGMSVTTSGGCLGYYAGSTGTATVTGNGSVWINPNTSGFVVGRYGTGNLTIENGGKISNYDGTLGALPGSTGVVTVRGAGSTWTNNNTLTVGSYGAGSLTIAGGGQVSSAFGYVAYANATSATAVVTGAGSTWTNTNELAVGNSGSGNLTIANGGRVSNRSAFVGSQPNHATGYVTVTGAGSTWTCNSNLYVDAGSLTLANGGQVSDQWGVIGNSSGSAANGTVTGAGSRWASSSGLTVGSLGAGNLTVADYGQVTAPSLSINSSSSMTLRISGNNMVVLGSNSTVGSLTNNGRISLYANTFLSAGVYTPISESQGRALTWTGNGTCSAFGGIWDTGNKTFTVPPLTPLAAGDTTTLTAGQRLLIAGSGQAVGVNFGASAGGSTFSANLATQAQVDDLNTQLSANATVLSAWNYTTDLTSNTVLLSYNVGEVVANLQIWHYDGSLWTMYSPDDLSYSPDGIASFTVSSFSGYAVTGVPVPEPGTLTILGLGAVAFLKARRRKERVDQRAGHEAPGERTTKSLGG